MPKVDFLYIALFFLLLPLEASDNALALEIEVYVCAFFIATLGIAHGAIDHHLFGVKNKAENQAFILKYVLAALGFGLVWLLSPAFAFSTFFLISGFHFGQSQWADLQGPKWLKRSLFFSWGIWLLSSYLSFNKTSLSGFAETALINDILHGLLSWSLEIHLLSISTLLSLLVISVYLKVVSMERLGRELYEMLIVSFTFYLFSPLLSFSLYFIILHSLRVLQQEYKFLHQKGVVTKQLEFIKLLSPFTIISLLGMLFFWATVQWLKLEVSLSLSALIFISCLTIPHAFVMNTFYRHKNWKKA